MVYSTGRPFTINFNFFKGVAKLHDSDRFILVYPNTYGKQLYNYISKNCLIPEDEFKLYLEYEKLYDLSKLKDKTMSEIGMDFSFDVDSNEEVKHVLYVTNPSTNNVKMVCPEICNKEENSVGKSESFECSVLFKESEPFVFTYKDSELPADLKDELGPFLRRNRDRRIFEQMDEVNRKCLIEDQLDSFKCTSSYEKPRRRHITAKNILNYENHDSSTQQWDPENSDFKDTDGRPEIGYVGLVNQAMTCYLNSLLQALYMTPEFRNALYNWEYVDGSERDEANSIPYQLQKLFLNLQTSSRPAVETTALTKSFGWDSTEAWQQHDIQELCRVMFDALERKFANTEQGDLINRLYEGKMIDYVKCLECGTEKTREDTFLDIPLPVRPFGSNVAYNNVEQALRGFVQYETLEGANQYYCEKCNKKCDAHKGLKFTKFPYLVTLHLKRFDFDYKTFHRIKLNDKVIFPDILNLNSFISTNVNHETSNGKEDINFANKCDDNSTTDSGTVNEDCAPFENSLSNSSHPINHDQDDDEGIDICNGPSTSNCSPQAQENESNCTNYDATDGPYQYELFSILIHSGTASGGHYYAYIKDFRTQEWLCFNDQNVTEITHDDIQRTYGGGPPRAYYSNASRTSTNAYMLMYRQIDPVRNALPMQVEDFPKHIQELLKKIKENEDNDMKKIQRKAYKILIYYRQSNSDEWENLLLYKFPDVTLGCLTEVAYEKLFLNRVVAFNQCRLVSYNPDVDLIIESYDGRENEVIGNIWPRQKSSIILLMETRSKDQTFKPYLPDGVTTNVFVVDTANGEIIDGPINVRAVLTQSMTEYKQMLGTILNMDPKQMQIVLCYNRSKYGGRKWLGGEDIDLQGLEPSSTTKVFVSCVPDTESQTFQALVTKFERVISLNVQLPDVSKETLEALNIAPLEKKPKEMEKPIPPKEMEKPVPPKEMEKPVPPKEMEKPVPPKETEKVVTNNVQTAPPGNDSSRDNNICRNVRRQDTCKRMRDLKRRLRSALADAEEEWNTPEQSNSEDSSLSDSDKTLVKESPEEDDDFQLTHAIPIEFHPRNFSNMQNAIETENWDIDDDTEYYFKATPYISNNRKLLKVIVDKTIKLSTLKKDLEDYVGVPAECFTILHFRDDADAPECRLFGLHSCVDGQRLNIKLERVFRPDEFEVKLFTLHLDFLFLFTFCCDWILSKEKTVLQTKQEILKHLEKRFGFDIPLERCRLRIKHHERASRVLLDDHKIEDYQYYMGYDKTIAIQELAEPEPVTDPDQVLVFVRKWSASIAALGEFEEIVLDEKTLEEVKKKISAISNIPVENLEVTKGRLYFYGKEASTEIQNCFCRSDYTLEGYLPDIQNGAVLFYRDNREQVTGDGEEDVKGQVPSTIHFFYDMKYNKAHASPRRQERDLKIFSRPF